MKNYKFPRHEGPLRAEAGHYYYTATLREVPVLPKRMTKQVEKLTLLPESIFLVEKVVIKYPGIWAQCLSHPHNRSFFIRVSGQELFSAGIHPLKSALVLLAMQGEDLPS